jgi:hypothetical protein
MPKYEAKITGMSIRDRENKAGHMELAFFDVDVLGIRLCGCLLKRTKSGGFVVSPPRINDDRVVYSSVQIRDNALLHSITMAARDVYMLMGGAHGAYAGQRAADDPDQPQEGSALSAILPAVGREELQ